MRQRTATFVGLLTFALLCCGLTAALGDEPQTIAQAVAQVRAVTDPNIAAQNRRRAQEAMKIVRARVAVINEWNRLFGMLQDKSEYRELGNSLDAFRKGLEKLSTQDARKKSAQWAWENKGGRCDEHAELMADILEQAGVPVRVMRMAGKTNVRGSTINHTFPVVGFAADMDDVFDNPWAWGGGFVADSWAGQILEAEPAWTSDWHFNKGKYTVSLIIGFQEIALARWTLFQLVRQGADGIRKYCVPYRRLHALYLKMPEKYRKEIETEIEKVAVPAPDSICGTPPPPPPVGCPNKALPDGLLQAALPDCEEVPNTMTLTVGGHSVAVDLNTWAITSEGRRLTSETLIVLVRTIPRSVAVTAATDKPLTKGYRIEVNECYRPYAERPICKAEQGSSACSGRYDLPSPTDTRFCVYAGIDWPGYRKGSGFSGPMGVMVAFNLQR